MKEMIKVAAVAVCVCAVATGCQSVDSSSTAAASACATTFTAMTPPVKNTVRVSHVRAISVKKAVSKEYRLDLSGVQAPYAAEIEYYTEKALGFDSLLTAHNFSPLTRNDSSSQLVVKVALSVTAGASGRRGTRYRPSYTITAVENGEQIWTVHASCESVLRDLSKINGWLPGLVASARMYIGQNRIAPMQSVAKYPEFLSAIGAL